MNPTFQPGDKILVSSFSRIEPADVIVFSHHGMTMVKRVIKKEGNAFIVRGDNFSESTDSLDFGAIAAHQIIGKVFFRYYSQQDKIMLRVFY